jgi:lysozyme
MNAEGLALLKRMEACRLKAYQDKGGVWTIGYGHTGDVHMGDAISQHQAEVILDHDLSIFEPGLLEILKGVALSENQTAALVCFVFNVGLGAFRRSRMVAKLRAGDYAGAALEFPRWNKIQGAPDAGLTKRRALEQALFRK